MESVRDAANPMTIAPVRNCSVEVDIQYGREFHGWRVMNERSRKMAKKKGKKKKKGAKKKGIVVPGMGE